MTLTKTIDEKVLSKVLKQVNKPGRYTGNEHGCVNKDFNSSTVKTVLAFPDLYELGISNFGLKIIYKLINSHPNFMADRTYAADKDFKQLINDNNIPLYGLESYIPIKYFDIVAFSMQYELNNTTMLGMLEDAGIALYSKDRTEEDPIIIAGGPNCFNPEPFCEFVDAVIIGDGEDVIIEILEAIEKLKADTNALRADKLKALSSINGVYIPSLYTFNPENNSLKPLNSGMTGTIKKCFSGLKKSAHPDEFPLPNISAIHDRAVVEIRRGCGRMCRFCQSCFVNLPVRERPHNEVMDLCYQSLDFTGYDELSLLSLSTSDYQGLEELALNLNKDLAKEEISISLPSQRADNFNIELAQQLQAVRKSTLTFAPEAGSKRLRAVINKNLEEEQIIESSLAAYKAGWYKIKFYFIIGLPTETYEDLDAIMDLITLVRKKANQLRAEDHSIKRPLDITCTLSIFVPKPFTPFQWCGQFSSEEIQNRKSYLISQVRKMKGVRLNFHDLFSSKLEGLFSRGDRSLNPLILNAYKNGAYLDSWTEYFSKNIWEKSINETGIDIEKLTTQTFETETLFPWEIIDIGLNREWLVKEYQQAFEAKNSIPCEESCTNCGVCFNLNVSPKYESRKESEKVEQKAQNKRDYSKKFRYRLKISKEGSLKYVSHLDWFRMIYRAVKRAKLPVAFSQGFNPSPKISIGNPLGLFVESISEFMDIELTENLDDEDIKSKLNMKLPETCRVYNVKQVPLKADSIPKTIHFAEYEATELNSDQTNFDFTGIKEKVSTIISQNEIIIEKKTKSKVKQIDLKPLIHSVNILDDRLTFTLSSNAEINIKPDEFLKIFSNPMDWQVKRINVLDKDFKSL